MDTNALKKFAQEARRDLLAQVEARLEKVLHTDSVELREKLGVVNELRAQLDDKGKENLVEEVAYTWFNRFCALRYMDVNQVTNVGVVSPTSGFSQPEILQEAKQGIFDQDWRVDQTHVQGLLDGSIPSSNPEGEAYRLLLVAVCNSYAEKMDFLFSRIEGYTELLMPEDLLSTQSVLHAVREALTQAVCQDVEVIGWLYQFYISEKKDEVMGRKGAVPKEDIPAVTQLFTPHWIVRYMVENSLGRLWLFNHPGSKIRDRMAYYISPEGQEIDFLKIDSPEELKILDPACGSGHILTYAFDLLYAIYEEMGYDPISIPQLILENNLYGIEIDKRAAMLSSFALMMKALEKDNRFFRRKVQPNILEMEDVSFDPQEVKAYMAKVGEDLWTQELWEGLRQFENAKTFGSLIRPVLKNVPKLREKLNAKGVLDELFLAETNRKVQKLLEMSEYLSPRYQVVVANPPYFSKGMDAEFKQFARNNYPESHRDTFSMFIERTSELAKSNGFIGLMTPFNWMFLSSFEKIRKKIINEFTLLSLIRPEFHAFFDSAFVSVCTFVINNNHHENCLGSFIDLNDFYGADIQAKKTLEAIENPNCGWYYCASTQKFNQIPGAPIAYWVSDRVRDIFSYPKISSYGEFKRGIATGDNGRFLRYHFEVSRDKASLNSKDLEKKWFGYNKGGEYRKWYGNLEYVINWENNGEEIINFVNERGKQKSRPQNIKFNFYPVATYSSLTSGDLSVRLFDNSLINDQAGNFLPNTNFHLLSSLVSFLNSKPASFFINILNPTMNILVTDLNSLPVKMPDLRNKELFSQLYKIAMDDWDNYELSWDFQMTPILKGGSLPKSELLSNRYSSLRNAWYSTVERMKNLEKENNNIFIKTYCLNEEISPDVDIRDITLTCNPNYRYRGDCTNEELEARLLEDTIKEFISYAVGCAFGRYSLEKPGLILGNQGETVEDYYRIVGNDVTFTPTETNVIPIVEGDWFPDGAAARFKEFLRVTFGEENFAENLRFIEDTLGKDLEKYFTRHFYKDHVQMYKNRPIYWLFSSPKGSFNALIYMHRYQPDTVSVVLNQYLREYRDKLTAHRRNLERISSDAGASAREKSQALKEIENISKTLAELKEYEDEVLYPLASKQIQIDLDDGVVVNYAKFGKALKKI